MEDHRKHVTICTENDAFGGALRILLKDYEVSIVKRLADVEPGVDALVYWLDSDMPTRSLAEIATSIPTLVLGEEDLLVSSVDANCRGFLTKTTPLDQVQEAVDTIINGGAVVPPDLLGALLRHLVDRRRGTSSIPGWDELTDREREVFRLAAQGARKEEIGETLFISPATARTHLQRVYRKLGVHSQAELVALAAQADSIDREEKA